jgi:hypothetical protein
MMKKYNSPPLTVLLFGILVWSCGQNDARFRVVLDGVSQRAILLYLAQNKIDTRSQVVTTTWNTGTSRSDIYISNTSILPRPNRVPTYYSIIQDSIVVFIYFGVEKAIERNTRQIDSEIQEVLATRQIKLEPDSGRFSHRQTWLYSSCGDDHYIIKTMSAFERDFLPCSYALMQDSSRYDSIYVVRRKEIMKLQ